MNNRHTETAPAVSFLMQVRTIKGAFVLLSEKRRQKTKKDASERIHPLIDALFNFVAGERIGRE